MLGVLRRSFIRRFKGLGRRVILSLAFPNFSGAPKAGGIDFLLREFLQQFEVLFFLEFVFLREVRKILEFNSTAHTIYLSRRFCFLAETCSCCDLNSSLRFWRLASLSLLEAGWISETLVSTGAAFAASFCLCFCFR